MNKKKTLSIISLMIACIMILSACSTPDTIQNESDQGDGTPGETTNQPQTTSAITALSYTSEIEKTVVMTVSITADPDEWQAMLDNADAEEYIPADITINGVTIENVGIRPKGNSSLSSIARDETTDRYSFKIKFDKYVDGQTWMGLDKLVLNNNYSDATSMKEYLSYDIMNYIGVDTPLYSYANISVNGENWGFYLAIEDVDSGYLARVKNDEGELYKPESTNMGMNEGGQNMADNVTEADNAENPADPAVPENFILSESIEQIRPDAQDRAQFAMIGGGARGADGGVSLVYTDDNESSYSAIFDNAETKTDEEDHQRVIEALKNLNNGTDLETYIDVDAVLRYLAAHTVVVNLDSYSGSMGHNYYLYENGGQISIIPWDYNMAFGGFQSGSASSIVNFPIDTPVSGVSMEDRPLISKLLEVPEYLEKYHQYLQEIIDGYFAGGKFEQKIDELNEIISNYIQNDPSAFYTYEQYQTAIVELKELGALRAESIQGQLDGTVPSTTEGQAAEPDKLIDASSVDMSALGGMGGGGMGDRQDVMNGAMPNMTDGLDMNNIQQAMEIIRTATGGILTDEQRSQLHDLGLSDEQIEQMLTTPVNGGPGGWSNR